ncbi:13294_t:CDS:2 [Funneliformis caledonium]|uniref:13294_t:CDS:1 n=1 Tax=Funneliformis caledonium TaxID=1117310 RepID=A0A9N9BJD5_9GLOM|nr:13294_t:CDS:2 [Funneliformis caledonium]
MRHVAEKLNIVLEDLYKQIGWPLYSKYGHAYEAFKLAITEPEKVFEGLEISQEINLEVTCFGYDGIDAIKSALKSGEACEIDDIQIKVKLVAPPLYVMITNALDKNLGIQTLEKAITAIHETIEKSGGVLTVKMKPRAVSETDDIELAALMARVEKENAEVSGDEDTDPEAGEVE